MQKRLSQDQLVKIVGEVERLSQRQQEELEPEQVQQILRELNLPPELLDEAMLQLQRREALAVETRRKRWIIAGILTVLVVSIAGVGFFIQQHQQAIARVSAQQDRITRLQDTGGTLATVTRPADVYYRVTLKDAPQGQQLSLACDWIDPSGQIVKQNRYQTQQIDRSVWPTHCHFLINTAAAAGTWKVQMFVEGRPISDATFEVR